MPDLIGHDIGRYHIIEQLGEGGMATVYKAYDTRLERDVAIKVIRRDAFPREMSERILKRFEREGKALARLSHPNIVRVYDYGEYQGSPYLVMEYVSGGTLKALTGRPMPLSQAANLLLPLARALEYAHEENLIHRDVKPANILMARKGQPMLSDFGIAKIMDMEEGGTLTGTNVGIGTPEYMAPEQGLGHAVDGRADVYALGVMFYELLTGRKPYQADTPMAVILKHVSDPLPRPTLFVPDLPAEAERVLFKALAKKPEDRFQNMSEFATALEKLAAPGAALSSPRPAAIPPKKEKPAQTLTRPQDSATRDSGQAVLLPAINVKPGTFPTWGYILGAAALLLLLAAGISLAWKMASPPSADQPISAVSTAAAAAPTLPPTPAADAANPNNPPGIGSSQVSNKDGMKLLYVPAGQFRMGSDQGKDDQKPPQTIYLDAFWIDQTLVTNAMYAKCVKVGNCQAPIYSYSHTRPGYYFDPQYADYPVIFVNWNQAKTYCDWAGRQLVTEAQWEKAARGTDERTYPWGEEMDPKKANYNGSDTTKVGSFPTGASPYGALDMAGNVWEWVADWYDNNYYSGSPYHNPTGPVSGFFRVLRGGAYSDNGNGSPSTYRESNYPTLQNPDWGFRCALNAATN